MPLPDVRARRPATGIGRSREEDRPSDGVFARVGCELLLPIALHAVDVCDDPAILSPVRLPTRPAFLTEHLTRRRLRNGRTVEMAQRPCEATPARQRAQELVDHQSGEAEPTASNGQTASRKASRASPAAAILDL